MNSPVRFVRSTDYQPFLTDVVGTESASLRRAYEGVMLTVYLAKPSREPWVSGALRRLVEQARNSYRTAYGQQVAIFDEYDDKAWVYVAVASYESQGLTFEEVLTLRFVPAAGLPLLSDDLNFYIHKGWPGRELVDLLGGGASTIRTAHTLRGCYSQGRMGAIRPLSRSGRALPGNRHIGLAWVLMLERFLEDTANADNRCRILTSQTTEQLRALGARIPTLPCDEHLGFAPGSIVLNRAAPNVREVCYSVPSYFLNLKDVSSLLSRLIAEGRLSTASAQNATTPGVPLERALRHPQVSSFKRLNLLFGARGSIAGSALTGDELRTRSDEEVRDGPVLRLTQLDQLEAELDQLRQAALGARSESFFRVPKAIDESA